MQTSQDGQTTHLEHKNDQGGADQYSAQPQDRDDPLGEDVEVDGWVDLLEHSKKFDKQMLKDWGALLDNLLTFIGLFSGVVTGFLLSSIVLLQVSFGQSTVNLLGQMSHQMSSFNVVNNMFNSTHQPTFTRSILVADEAAVTINVLWICSLTISLMAAFWTIAVQQWLRHIPLPRELGVRESIRLRQLRRDGLIHWQLPVVVFLLPLAVQISVLLFLLGLLRLLQGLDHFVADTFAVLGGILFVLFLITLPMPLFRPGCPFKSPLIPTLYGPIKITAIVIRTSILHVLAASPSKWRFSPGAFLKGMIQHCRHLKLPTDVWFKLSRRWDGFLAFDANPHIFWRQHERWYMWRGKAFSNKALDLAALLSVPIVVSGSSRDPIRRCLREFGEKEQRSVCMRWICHDLGIRRLELKEGPSELFAGRLENLYPPTLVSLQSILLDALPKALTSPPIDFTLPKISESLSKDNKTRVKVSEMKCLALLFWGRFRLRVDSDQDPDGVSIVSRSQSGDTASSIISLIRRVMNVHFDETFTATAIITRNRPSLWLPITLLFRYCEGRPGTVISRREASTVARCILAALKTARNGQPGDYSDKMQTALPGALAAVATSLQLYINNISEHSSTASLIEDLSEFHNFLSASPEIKNAFERSRESRRRKQDTCELIIVDRLAVLSISKSLATLAGHEEATGVCKQETNTSVVERRVRAGHFAGVDMTNIRSRALVLADKLLEICHSFTDYEESLGVLRRLVGN